MLEIHKQKELNTGGRFSGQGIIVNICNNWEGETSENTMIAMLETLLSKMEVKKKKEILEKEYGMVMTREIGVWLRAAAKTESLSEFRKILA